ncbi:PKD domain-containing protein [Lentzea aerocolonigenes]|uniref:PKD domain-containing protein n=1 Tax=Lentzea aerocolonigenes TaxID=68170 RepID=UPI0004C321FD|nr:PKD domain-containing protein [Lentzea aerocolonigenes]MCP2250349.1 PKD domain-containing protein [Lentzea aerocolonigenes]
MRTFIATMAAALATALLPGVALAADPPANDDFGNATTITALPFSAKLTTVGATKATDDPTACHYWGQSTVWTRYTAQEDGFLRVSSSGGPTIGVYTGDRGALTLVPGACTYNTGFTADVFPVKAGTTYHFALIENYAGYGREFTFDLTTIPAAPNDNRASATVVGFPATLDGDLRRATSEPDELTASCGPDANQSVWFRYTPDRTRIVHVKWSVWSTVLNVRRAADLSELDCAGGSDPYGLVFTATAGESYLVRVAQDAESAGQFKVSFANAPAIKPNAYTSVEQPSVFDDVQFEPGSGDPLGRELVSGEIQFGDGASTPVTGTQAVSHRYAKDGKYTVRVTGTTKDGRTGTTEQVLEVATHDVKLSGLSVPSTARAGETKRIKVSVTNTRYDENVRVSLKRKSVHGYYEEVGYLIQRVAASPTGKVEFPFAYTYTAADAAAGQVEFNLVTVINSNYEDAQPADNELVAVTAVRATAESATANARVS